PRRHGVEPHEPRARRPARELPRGRSGPQPADARRTRSPALRHAVHRQPVRQGPPAARRARRCVLPPLLAQPPDRRAGDDERYVASGDAHHPPRPRAPVAARPPRRPALTPAPRAVAVAAATAGLVATVLLGLTAASAPPPLLGFAPDAAARQRESAARPVAALRPQRPPGLDPTPSAPPP